MNNETIAAISTPYGRGGIAVIRISGPDTVDIAAKMFAPAGGKRVRELASNSVTYGNILSGGETVDDGMLTLFRAPHSYTGEDTAEISCHGGVLVSGAVLQAAYEAGASPAGPGEFTKRAFMNGKLSLSSAEAVINIIDAESKESLRLARANASGALSRRIDEIYETLTGIAAEAYVYADYPDEDLTDISVPEMKRRLSEARDSLMSLYDSYKAGHAIGEGIYTVILGKPNSGKSSLLNRLLGRERAIVSDVEGTTRDFIEESVPVGSIILRLCDTAGIRKSDDRIEKLGIERSYEALYKAELVYAVFDGSREATDEDIEMISKLGNTVCRKIAVINKCDLETVFDADLSSFDFVIKMSAKQGIGVSELCEKTEKLFVDGKIDYDSSPLIANARQAAAVKRSADAVARAVDALEAGYTQDIAGLDIEDAMSALAETDGRAVGADIVDNIFHNFCVGK